MTTLKEIIAEIEKAPSVEEQNLVIIDYIERASINKEYIPVLEDVADDLFNKGFFDLAITILSELYHLTQYKKYAKKIAFKLYQHEEYDKAYYYWLERAKGEKENSKLLLLEARLLKELNKTSEAINQYRYLIKNYPTMPEPYEELGDIYREEENTSQAETFYSTLYHYMDGYENLRGIRLKLLEVEAMKEVIELSEVQKYEQDERIPIETEDEFFAFANIYKKLFQYDKAIEYGEKALQKDGDNINYSLLLIELYKLTGNKSKLYMGLNETARTILVGDPIILEIAAVAKDIGRLNDDIIEKLITYAELVENYDDFILIMDIVVNYYLDKKDAPTALYHLGNWQDTLLDYEYMTYHYAIVYEELGLFDKAEENYLVALEFLLNADDLVYRLINLYVKQNDFEKALELAQNYQGSIYDIEKLKKLREKLISKKELSIFDEYKVWENDNGD